MHCKKLPPQEYLMQRLRYDPKTGNLWWLASSKMAPHWNQRYAGQFAFTTQTGGYNTGRVDGRRYLAHRIIWKMVYGDEPEQIDHVNGVKSDNSLKNLRAASASENMKNKAKPKNNASGFVGVSWNKHHSTWQARIGVNGRDVHLGYFATIDEAACARLSAQKQLGFDERHGQ